MTIHVRYTIFHRETIKTNYSCTNLFIISYTGVCLQNYNIKLFAKHASAYVD